MKREQFIATLFRLGILGILAFITGLLVVRRKVTLTACDSDFHCRGCGRSGTCGLPEAKTYRNHGKG